MTFLNNGGDAVDAVEIAIKVLEDREITNAGYGSNLAMDGTVECDATIVDHYGRSGAVGAIAREAQLLLAKPALTLTEVRNPIHVARLVLEQTTKPMSLRRVPPNLLVGQGATDFAFEQGLPVLPHDALISAAAKERWLRWRVDLKRAGGEEGNESGTEPSSQRSEDHGRHVRQNEHDSQSTLQSIWNEGQPISPQSTPKTTPMNLSIDGEKTGFSRRPGPFCESTADTPAATPVAGLGAASAQRSGRGHHALSPKQSVLPPTYKHQHGSDGHANSYDESSDEDNTFIDTNPQWKRPKKISSGLFDGSSTMLGNASTPSLPIDLPSGPRVPGRADYITDTVGAIAIDCFGNIAAGSSSGGIGMKHRGRTGPAALVGIGSAVIPIEPEDCEKASVATVTSGTGEHMATTMAAATCASRLYHSNRRSKIGGSERTSEENAMKAFVDRDFMSELAHSEDTTLY